MDTSPWAQLLRPHGLLAVFDHPLERNGRAFLEVAFLLAERQAKLGHDHTAQRGRKPVYF